MSSPSPPPDNSAYIAQQQAQEAKDAQARADAKAAQDKADLAALRNSVRSSSGSNVDQFFRSRGVDPTAYEGDINSQLDTILNAPQFHPPQKQYHLSLQANPP